MGKTALFAALAIGLSCFAGEEIIARWDFTTGSIDSVGGKYRMSARGKTAIAGQGAERRLAVGLSPKEKPEGIILLGKGQGDRQAFPELSPKGPFGIRCTFRLRERTTGQPYVFLWDSKYVNYDSTTPEENNGVCFWLEYEKDGKVRPYAMTGHGTFSLMFWGQPVEFLEDGKHTIAFEYDGKDTGTFRLDGMVNGARKCPRAGGDITPAYYGITIGDRFAPTFCRFDGDLFDLAIYKPTP